MMPRVQLTISLLALAAMLLLGPVAALPAAERGSQPAPERSDEDLAVELVKQLGDESFRVRERATHALEELGVPAKRPLLEGLKSPDAEVRTRCRRALATVLELDFQERLAAFAARTEGRAPDLPGWQRFQALAGTSPPARELFVAMQRAEAVLLEAADLDAETAGEALEARVLALQAGLYQGGQRTRPALGSLSAIFFVASDPRIPVDERLAQYLYNFSYQFNSQAAPDSKPSGPAAEPLKRILGAWVVRGSRGSQAYPSLMLAMRHDLPEGLQPALDLLQQPAAQPKIVEYAILGVGKFGDQRHLAALEPLLENESLLYTQNNAGQPRRTELRDIALAVLVHLSGEPAEEYGLGHVEKNPQLLFAPSSIGFTDNADRLSAIARWKRRSATEQSASKARQP